MLRRRNLLSSLGRSRYSCPSSAGEPDVVLGLIPGGKEFLLATGGRAGGVYRWLTALIPDPDGGAELYVREG